MQSKTMRRMHASILADQVAYRSLGALYVLRISCSVHCKGSCPTKVRLLGKRPCFLLIHRARRSRNRRRIKAMCSRRYGCSDRVLWRRFCREAHAPKSVEGNAAGGGEEKPVSLRLPGLSLADNLPAGSSFLPERSESQLFEVVAVVLSAGNIGWEGR